MTLAKDLTLATQDEVVDLLDLAWVRSRFPSLSQTVNGHPAVYLDGPGGTQVPQSVIDAISDYLRSSNANTDGFFATSQRTDAMLAGARVAMADFLACDPEEVIPCELWPWDSRHAPGSHVPPANLLLALGRGPRDWSSEPIARLL